MHFGASASEIKNIFQDYLKSKKYSEFLSINDMCLQISYALKHKCLYFILKQISMDF